MALARVMLVDDEPFVRSMLSTALTALSIEVAAACGTAREAMSAAEDVEVAILDLDLGPGPSGVDIAHALRERHRSIGLVMLTGFSDPRIHDPRGRRLPRGMRYLVKSELADPSLLRAVILDARREPLREGGAQVRADLTANQIDVLRLVALGQSNAQISQELGVGEKAIERTIGRILEVLEIDRSAGNARIQLARAYFILAGRSLP